MSTQILKISIPLENTVDSKMHFLFLDLVDNMLFSMVFFGEGDFSKSIFWIVTLGILLTSLDKELKFTNCVISLRMWLFSRFEKAL